MHGQTACTQMSKLACMHLACPVAAPMHSLFPTTVSHLLFPRTVNLSTYIFHFVVGSVWVHVYIAIVDDACVLPAYAGPSAAVGGTVAQG